MTTANQVLSHSRLPGIETCFHDRHIEPQIYAGLNGSNWSIKDYEARGGYQALRTMLGKNGGEPLTQDQVIAVTVKESACAVAGVRVSPRVGSGASCPASFRARSIWCVIPTRESQGPARTGTS